MNQSKSVLLMALVLPLKMEGEESIFFFFLLSLDAHNHVDDYSGTLGGVRKVHISALVTSPRN